MGSVNFDLCKKLFDSATQFMSLRFRKNLLIFLNFSNEEIDYFGRRLFFIPAKPDPVAPFFLGEIHGSISTPRERQLVAAMRRIDRGPDTG